MPIIYSQGPSTINKTRFITIYCNNDEMIYARLDDCLEVCVVGKHWQGICRSTRARRTPLRTLWRGGREALKLC